MTRDLSLLHNVQACPAVHPLSYSTDAGGRSPLYYSGRGVSLTTHLHQTPKSRMIGAKPSLLHLFKA
jgi:hypothetical protein